MSQFVLDEQLDLQVVLPRLQRWTSAVPVRALRPSQLILDDRIPAILLEQTKPTFVTIDKDFWDRRLCHPDYCILYFALRDDEQELLPRLLRKLLKVRGFQTRGARMGKVARIGAVQIDFYEYLTAHLQHASWPKRQRRH